MLLPVFVMCLLNISTLGLNLAVLTSKTVTKPSQSQESSICVHLSIYFPVRNTLAFFISVTLTFCALIIQIICY